MHTLLHVVPEHRADAVQGELVGLLFDSAFPARAEMWLDVESTHYLTWPGMHERPLPAAPRASP